MKSFGQDRDMSGYELIEALDGPCQGTWPLLGQLVDGVPHERVSLEVPVHPPGPLGEPNLAAEPIGTRRYWYQRVGYNEEAQRWVFQQHADPGPSLGAGER